MFPRSTAFTDAGPRPTRDRSMWVEVADGVWAPHPVVAEAELPDPAEHRRLTDTRPGAGLAEGIEHALLDLDGLDDAEVVDAITGAEHLARWAAGVQAQLVAEFAHRRPGDEPTLVCTDTVLTGSRWAPDELGLALEQTRFDATTRLARSLRLTHVLPDTLAALTAGAIDERRAVAICDTTALLPAAKARAVEAIVLPAAPGRTLRQLRDRLRRAVHRVDPDGEHRRHQAAHDDRRVTISSRDEGMASIWLCASSPDAEAAFAMITRLAEAVGEDGRTLDQRRSDIGIQLWQGRLTLTDLDDVSTAISARTGTAPHETTTDTDRTNVPDSGAEAAADTSGSGNGTELGAPAAGSDASTTAASATSGTRTDTEPGALTGTGTDVADLDTAIDDDTTSTDTTSTDTTSTGGAATDPDSTAPEDIETGSGPPQVADAGPGRPREQTPTEQTLIDAVAAVLARRPQVHETVRKPLIQVVVGLDTLTGASQRPAELLGHGPIDADTARALAADALWKRLTTDPLSGTLLDHGRTTYRPPTPLADHVTGRDQYCRFPTCTRRVRELDHHEQFSGIGHTKDTNLNGYCRTHHLLKEHQDWHVLAHPDGRLTWITPTGQRYVSEPYDYRPFTDPLPDLDEPGAPSADVGTDDEGEPGGPVTGDDDPPPF
ncbi:uncharacterized protein DUF222 [Pseudonocardia sediminis]|uniref:Uncharacterized protein DUF222 n=1 Tax=Pseudonocardia sediminis TaxID=1397368 RepID=A0A4Q7UTT1_PSEST|nr:DUF222 domain-containing protein [Pseudonocardia sediminis]RZT84424.1 uncharacterized protein DUF222 [Pseudonocardia sediminis]